MGDDEVSEPMIDFLTHCLATHHDMHTQLKTAFCTVKSINGMIYPLPTGKFFMPFMSLADFFPISTFSKKIFQESVKHFGSR